MPLLTRLAIRAALLYLIGALVLLGLPALGVEALRVVGPSAIHLLTVGWLTQLILAVAFWMFPLLPKPRQRGDERLMAAALLLLNGGVLLRLVAEPWQALHPGGSWAIAGLGLSALLQAASAVAGAISLWPRAKGKP